MTTLYGIRSCDTVKKAIKWLDDNNLEYTFVDFRKDGVSSKQIQTWIDILSWDILVNKRSTTWRGLSDDAKSNLSVDMIQENPTLIKRPVLERSDQVYVGFKKEIYDEIFKNNT